MKISAKTEYACVAMLELSLAFGDGPVQIRKIADQHGIPSRFLVQILLQLKSAGLVTSTRGAAGGYQLARPPQEITLGSVMAVIDPPEERLTTNTLQPSQAVQVLLSTWQEVADRQRAMLEDVTFANLLERVQASNESMYYI